MKGLRTLNYLTTGITIRTSAPSSSDTMGVPMSSNISAWVPCPSPTDQNLSALQALLYFSMRYACFQDACSHK